MPDASSAIAYYEHMSPSLLAQQPSEPKFMPSRVNYPWEAVRSHLEARLVMMRNWRLSWAQYWALLAAYIQPRRNTWFTEGAGIGAQPVPNSMIRGLPINQNIIDPTGTQALRICSSGLFSGLMSPTRPWFKIRPAVQGLDDNDAVQRWCEIVEDRIYGVMAGSNFYEAGAQMFEDLVLYGTAPIIIYEDVEDLIRCYNPCAGEYYLGVGATFRVDTLYRQFVLTIAQIVDMFGLENCPTDVQQMWHSKGGSLEMERIVAHAIEPNFPINNNGTDVDLLKGDFTYREVYWMWGLACDRPLSVRGFEGMPFIAPRAFTVSNDPYGRSIAMDVLPDIMQLQQETKRKAEAIEKSVRPPLLASVELKNQPSSILPGHVTYVSNLSAQTGMRPIYEVRPEIAEMMQDLTAIQNRVKSGFLVDLFMMLDQMEGVQPRNQLEITERRSEKMQVIGPLVESFQSVASQAIKRIFAIMVKNRLIPPAPPELRGSSLDIEYVSMFSIAQKAAQTASMEKLAAVVGNLGAVYPEAKASLDPVTFLQKYNELLNNPKELLNSPDKIAALMQKQAQAAQQQQAMSEGMAAVQGAQTLSQTPVGAGSTALNAILGLSNPQGNA